MARASSPQTVRAYNPQTRRAGSMQKSAGGFTTIESRFSVKRAGRFTTIDCCLPTSRRSPGQWLQSLSTSLTSTTFGRINPWAAKTTLKSPISNDPNRQPQKNGEFQISRRKFVDSSDLAWMYEDYNAGLLHANSQIC